MQIQGVSYHQPLVELGSPAALAALTAAVKEVWDEIQVGESINRHPMSLTSLECPASELVNSDTCPRPTTQHSELRLGGLTMGTRKFKHGDDWLQKGNCCWNDEHVRGPRSYAALTFDDGEQGQGEERAS